MSHFQWDDIYIRGYVSLQVAHFFLFVYMHVMCICVYVALCFILLKSASDIVATCRDISEELTAADIEEMLAEADYRGDGNGVVGIDDFIEMCKLAELID